MLTLLHEGVRDNHGDMYPRNILIQKYLTPSNQGIESGPDEKEDTAALSIGNPIAKIHLIDAMGVPSDRSNKRSTGNATFPDTSLGQNDIRNFCEAMCTALLADFVHSTESVPDVPREVSALAISDQQLLDRSKLAKPLLRILKKGLSLELKDRYLSARELAEDLRLFSELRALNHAQAGIGFQQVEIFSLWCRRSPFRAVLFFGFVLMFILLIAFWRLQFTTSEALAKTNTRIRYQAIVDDLEKDSPESADINLQSIADERSFPWKVLRGQIDRHLYRYDNLETPVVDLAFSHKPETLWGLTQGGDTLQFDLTHRTFHKVVLTTPEKTQHSRIAVSPGADCLATLTRTGTVRLYSLASRKLLSSRDCGASTIAFSPDGEWFAYDIEGERIQIQSLHADRQAEPIALSRSRATAKDGRTLNAFETQPKQLRFSRDSTRIALNSIYQTEVWEIASGQSISPIKHGNLYNGMSPIAWTHDGDLISGAGEGRQLTRWNTFTGESIGELPINDNLEYQDSISHIVLSGDRIVFSSHISGRVTACDMRSGKEVWSFHENLASNNHLDSLVSNGSGTRLAFALNGQVWLREWHGSPFLPLSEQTFHGDPDCFFVSHHDSQCVWIDSDSCLISAGSSGAADESLERNLPCSLSNAIGIHVGKDSALRVLSVELGPQETLTLRTMNSYKSSRIEELAYKFELQQLPPAQDSSGFRASAGDDRFLLCWDRSGERGIVVDRVNRSAYIFDSNASPLVQLLPDRDLVGGWMSPDGHSCIVTNAKGFLTHFRVSTNGSWQPEGRKQMPAAFECGDFSDDGNFFAASGSDGFVWLGESKDIENLQRLSRHTHRVVSCKFTSDSHYLISADNEGAVVLWDITAGAEVFRFETAPGLTSLRIAEGSGAFYTTHADRRILTWPLGKERQ